MKALTENETKLLDALELVQKGFDLLPYHLAPPHGNEKSEFKKRIDEAKYIIAIRGMLRDGQRFQSDRQIESNKQKMIS